MKGNARSLDYSSYELNCWLTASKALTSAVEKLVPNQDIF